ncbi:enoyl-CoA hydratase-related protein [Microlunatus panaciterrae]|uniref:2-(1,2-epoxy-1,2-dihydrophenyl)acetyl-CoA isomerase n=1 Tax=Microlunatus panaciterrae TaxID=400768 RepID=A0ABS2RG10_9ACTN|nr:enoyl-CoA hydratase-related protein [Microlunatus panaciterrae]MBM7797934.1 2-(1,2-epoxy-1,2-dihydrophenyl)acetyl-CoA isomerase [Microlunatus panaciterrae]
MSEGPLVVTAHNGVGTIRFNRPAAMNALDTATKIALLAALRELAADASVRCLVLTGTGRAFCVGQDLKEHIASMTGGDLDAVWSTVPEHYNPIALTLHEMEKPVIAAVNGVAAGAGASLAFLADYRIVAESAGFNLAFAAIALSCDTGSSWTLPRLVGPTRAMDLLLHPRTISAAEAADWGIASEVVADAAFDERVAAVAERLAHGPTLAYASIRRSVAFSAGHPLAESLEFEASMMQRTGASGDHRAAVEAFLAKQRPAAPS